MAFVYGFGLAMVLLAGAALGLFLTVAHYERLASQQREYEKEMADGRDFYAALAMVRQASPVSPADEEASAA